MGDRVWGVDVVQGDCSDGVVRKGARHKLGKEFHFTVRLPLSIQCCDVPGCGKVSHFRPVRPNTELLLDHVGRLACNSGDWDVVQRYVWVRVLEYEV